MKRKPLVIGAIRGTNEPLILTPSARSTGVHIMGAPGSGKSKLLEHIGRYDIRSGNGLLVIDPHGDSVRELTRFGARYRLRRNIYVLDVSSGDHVLGLDCFGPQPGTDISTRVERAVNASLKAWSVDDPNQTPRMLRWLRNTFTVAIEAHRSVPELAPLFEFGNEAVRRYLTRNTSVAAEWEALNQLRTLTQFDDQIQSTKNRLDALTRSRTTRRFFAMTEPTLTLNLARAMDAGDIILVNLQPSPNLDPRNARLFGSLLVSQAFDTLRQRVARRGRPLRPFSVIIDEAQNFLSSDIPELFAQGRKYGLYLTIAHQFAQQMREEDERVWAALNGAARTKILFAVGSDADAKEMVHEMFPGQINYTEVKHRTWQTKFRPVQGWVETTSQTVGGSSGTTRGSDESRGHSVSHGTSRSATHTTGRSTGHTTGHDVGHSDSVTESHSHAHAHGKTAGWSVGRTVGHARSTAVSDATSETYTDGHSRTTGLSHAEGVTHALGHAIGQSQAGSATRSLDADGNVLVSTTDGDGSSIVATETSGVSSVDTASESETESESHSVGTSHVETHAESESVSESAALSESESETDTDTDGRSEGKSDSESWSESDTETDSVSHAETDGTSRASTESRTNGSSRSRSEGRNWSKAVSRVPITGHQEFFERIDEFHTLEEQRQRAADALRLQPQRVFTIRTPDGRACQVEAPFIPPIRLSDHIVDAYRAELSRKTGALSAAVVDALIEDKVQRLHQEAATFDAQETEPVHLIGKDDDTHPPITLNPGRRRQAASRRTRRS